VTSPAIPKVLEAFQDASPGRNFCLGGLFEVGALRVGHIADRLEAARADVAADHIELAAIGTRDHVLHVALLAFS